jgi:hypothetical protein
MRICVTRIFRQAEEPRRESTWSWKGARVEKRLQDRGNSARQTKLPASILVARSPDQKCKADDQNQDNQHPILTFDSKNVKRLNEKLHRVRPFFGQNMRFGKKKILFFYSRCVTTLRPWFGSGTGVANFEERSLARVGGTRG